jgi:hypothetical protein
MRSEAAIRTVVPSSLECSAVFVCSSLRVTTTTLDPSLFHHPHHADYSAPSTPYLLSPRYPPPRPLPYNRRLKHAGTALFAFTSLFPTRPSTAPQSLLRAPHHGDQQSHTSTKRFRYRKPRSRQPNGRGGVPSPQPPSRASKDDPRIRMCLGLGFLLRACQLISLQLTTNRDKKSACLTCKQMQLLATPLLYRHMEVSSQCLDTRFKESISKRHPGLKHIRTLRILALRDTFTIGPHIAGKGAASAIRRLFATIPEHSLTHFEYVHSTAIPQT